MDVASSHYNKARTDIIFKSLGFKLKIAEV
jgi:hypothetical protein